MEIERCSPKVSSESIVRDIKRKTRRKFSSEEKIRAVLNGLRGKDSIYEVCRREAIAPNQYNYRWSKDFLEAGKKRLQGILFVKQTVARYLE